LWKIIHFIENHSIIINQRFDGMPIAFNTEISVMKKAIILFFSLFMVVGIVQAQLRKVPSVVTNAFTAQYPTATNVTWKDNLTNFEAQFDLSGNHTVAKFKSGGEWIETQKDLAFDGTRAIVLPLWREGGKSGQHRATHRLSAGFPAAVRGRRESATENNYFRSNAGEKVKM
jgi:hypothetical protein